MSDGTDPRALFQVAWTTSTEAADDDSPVVAPSATLAVDQGAVVSGSLEGTGWFDGGSPSPVTDDRCADKTGAVTPGIAGAYVGDVDFINASPSEDGTLCVTVAMDDPGYGFDLLVFPLQSGCGVPDAALVGADGATAAGASLGGASGDMSVPVVTGTSYGVMIAGYYPNSADANVGYRLGVSLVHPAAKGTTLCPLLPDDGGSS